MTSIMATTTPNGKEKSNGGCPAPALPDTRPSALAVTALGTESRFLASQNFIISCGTVTLDIKAGKVLLVYNKPNGIYQLPKGRKDIGEDSLLKTALRETLEETGYDVRPLTLRVPTRSTPKDHAPGATNGSSGKATPTNGSEFVRLDGEETPRRGLTLGLPSQEPIACCHWSDPQTRALKMVFHFAAEADSTAAPSLQRSEDAAKHQVYWIEYAEALERLWYDEERQAVRKALCDVERSE